MDLRSSHLAARKRIYGLSATGMNYKGRVHGEPCEDLVPKSSRGHQDSEGIMA